MKINLNVLSPEARRVFVYRNAQIAQDHFSDSYALLAKLKRKYKDKNRIQTEFNQGMLKIGYITEGRRIELFRCIYENDRAGRYE